MIRQLNETEAAVRGTTQSIASFIMKTINAATVRIDRPISKIEAAKADDPGTSGVDVNLGAGILCFLARRIFSVSCMPGTKTCATSRAAIIMTDHFTKRLGKSSLLQLKTAPK